jgi:hypothetical protein
VTTLTRIFQSSTPASVILFFLSLHIKKKVFRKNKLHSSIRPHINIHPGFSGRNTKQNSHGFVDCTKSIKAGAITIKEHYPWRGRHYLTELTEV